MRLSQPVTAMIRQDWVPVAIKKWWYSEPPGVNDLRVAAWIGIFGGIAAAILAISFLGSVQ